MPSLKPLDEEVLKVIHKLAVTRWTDIKRGLPKETLSSYKNKTIDVYLGRSLNRLESLGYLYKAKEAHKHPRYHLTPSGAIIAYKLKQGIEVKEPIRSNILAFGHALQWIKNHAIIQSKNDTVEKYFMRFREEINQIDIDRFVEEAAALEDKMRNEDDPWDDSQFVKYLGNREIKLEIDPSLLAFLDYVIEFDAEMRAKSSRQHKQDPS